MRIFFAVRCTSLVTWPQTPCSLKRLHSACARIHLKSAEVPLQNGRAGKHSRLDSALTIHSSRHRFAARLNSGVSATQCVLLAFDFSNLRVACSSVHKPCDMATDSVQPRTAALRLCTNSREELQGSTSQRTYRQIFSARLRANNSFKPRPLRGLGRPWQYVVLPRPQSGPA